ncbi:MAG: YaaA family protein [Cellulosilyticaceae bacterium]
MLTIMSPTKTFREIEENKPFKIDKLVFNKEVRILIDELKKYNEEELAKLMKMSETLAEINCKRNKYFDEEIYGAYPAIYYYYGEAFKELEAETLDEESIYFAQDHLRILSGLYGIVSPLDIIKAYRLEMATKLKTSDTKDLYTYWKDKLTDYLIYEISQTTGEPILINLASDEYAKAIDWKKLNQQFRSVTVVFKEKKGDTYKVVGTYAKKARGKFMRYMLENQINTLEEIKQFNQDGYQFNPDLSSLQTITFTR